jgi:hypothetical protein
LISSPAAKFALLQAKNPSAAEIHRELCAVYSQNVMSEETIKHWCRIFKDGRTDVHDEEQNVRPSVVSDNLVQNVDKNLCKTALHNFRTFVLIYTNFTQRSLLDYRKFCARWVPKILTGDDKMQRMASAVVDVFSEIPQKRLQISESHRTSNRR